jgi:hypothetical protein
MWSKISPVLKTAIFVAGAVSLQACFYGGGGGHPYYAQPAPYAYAPPPVAAYQYARPPVYAYAPPPVRVGDYDEHHQWHNRAWWVQNNHAWVQQHHPDWVASREYQHNYH